MWIANPEQRGGARRLKHEIVAAPPQISEPRQDERIACAEPHCLRPVIRDLRLDGEEVRAVWTSQPIFDEIASRQAPNQRIDALIGAPTASECGERQAGTERWRARRYSRVKRAKPNRVAVEGRKDLAAFLHLERDVRGKPHQKIGRFGPPPSPLFGSAHAAVALIRYAGEWD
jgi:hypothetical protein